MADFKILTLNDTVLLSDGECCKLIKLGDVRFFETCGNYTQTYFGNEKLLIYRSLSYLNARLSGQYFFMANRQQIINLSHIKDIQLLEKSIFRIEMTCGKKIELSRRRSRFFRGSMSL